MHWIHFTKTLSIQTKGRATYSITHQIVDACRESKVRNGHCVIFIRHTSASLLIYENADPTAREDLHSFFNSLVPDDAIYSHQIEGPDDATSHLKAALTRTTEVIPIVEGQLILGTWQGIYLFEHRCSPHQREIIISVLGTS